MSDDELTTQDFVEWYDQLETFDDAEDDAYVLLSTTDRNILEQFRDAFAKVPA